MLFIGCASFEKQHFKATQFFLSNKGKLAELCASEFPSETKYIKGDEVVTIEEIEVPIPYQVDCDSVVNANKGTENSNVVNGIIYTKHIKELRQRIDTLQKSNTALETKLRAEINKLNASNVLLTEKLEDGAKQLKQASKESRNKDLAIGGLGLLLMIGLIIIIKK